MLNVVQGAILRHPQALGWGSLLLGGLLGLLGLPSLRSIRALKRKLLKKPIPRSNSPGNFSILY